jgi:hypothetical protein
MLRTIAIYGLIGAFIVGAFMVAGSLTWADGGQSMPENGVVVGYLTQLVALTVVLLGVKAHRDHALGGVIKFFPALGIGVAISAVASLGWVIAWEIVLAITKLDFPALMRESMLAEAQARQASEAEIQKVIADADGLARMYSVAPIRWAITFVEMFPVGVLVSLISAALLRNSRFLPARPAAAA